MTDLHWRLDNLFSIEYFGSTHFRPKGEKAFFFRDRRPLAANGLSSTIATDRQ